ncbi:MAG: ROK family protein [Brevefilum sp.]
MATRTKAEILDDLSVSTKILGINVSGIKTIAVYGDMNGLVYERMQMETPNRLPFLEGFDAVCSLADKLLNICRAQGLASPEVISLAVSGPVDLLKGILLSPPDLPEWRDAQITGRLRVRYNLPVFIEHRSSAAALAEAYFGAGIGVENLLLIDQEPVVSTGFVFDRKVYHGEHDAAGEIGRMRMTMEGPAGLGDPGSLTGYASSYGMAELASLRFPQHWPSPPRPYELVKACNEGDADALAVVTEAAEHLGKTLLWLIFTLDPEMVLFGHPGDSLGETLLTPLRDAVLRYGGGEARQLPLLGSAKLGVRLDDIAAMMAAIEAFKTRQDSK